MKVYLVSEVKCYTDEPMIKRFEAFSTKKDAIEYKNWLKETWIAKYMNYYDCEEDEIEDWVYITYDKECLWGSTLNSDGTTEELEIEVVELDLLSIK